MADETGKRRIAGRKKTGEIGMKYFEIWQMGLS